ncbi:hypothetical protein Gotur_027089 [Gossypium turneri]
MTQREKCDSLDEGYVLESWDFTRISVTQTSLQELKEIWDQWNDRVVSLLGELIWCVQLRNTWPYFVAQRFK